MLRRIPAVTVLILLLAFPPLARPFVAGIDRRYPPHEWWGGGAARGYNVEVLRAVAAEMGEQVEFRPMVWADAVRALARGEVDVLCMARTPERETRYELTEHGLLDLALAIFVRTETSGIPDLAALAGRTVAVQENDVSHRLLRERCPQAVVVPVPDQAEALHLVARGEVTAAFGNRYTAHYLVRQLGLSRLKEIGEPVPIGPRVLAVRKGRTALRERLDRALARLEGSGELRRIRQKWFGRALSPGRDWTPVLRAGALVLAAVLVGFGLLAAWNRSLRREVRRRTDALRASEQRYRSLLDTALEAVLVVDQKTRLILYANHPTERLMGVPAGDIVGRRLDELVCPEDLPRALEAVAEVARGERGDDPRAYRIVRADGTRRTVEAVSSRVKYEGREAVLIYARDVTEREEMRRRAEQASRLRSVGRLAGGLAHEFNNILAAVLGHAELGEREARDPEAVTRRFRAIAEAAQRGGEVARQLLAYSRQQRLDPRVVDLCREVRRDVEFLRPLMPRNIEIRVDCPDHPLWVRIDPGRLQEALVNLATNARDAMPRGGRLRFEVDTVEVRPDYARGHDGLAPGRYARITVSDTGAGIPRDVLPHIFEPFFTTKPVGRGTGLGLSSVHGFVKQSRGHIHAYSEAGRGATIRIYLPLADPDGTVRKDMPREATVERTAEGDVWVVEDEPALCEILRDALRAAGYRVSVFSSGVEALSALSTRAPPDAAVVDLVLEGERGLEVGRAFRRRIPGIPIVYTSGYSEAFAREEGLLDPGEALLTKPFQVAELVEVLARLLRHRQEHPVQEG